MIETAPLQFPTQSQYSLYRFRTLKSVDFDMAEYSRLKYGSLKAARRFGRELADAFFNDHRTTLNSGRCVVVPSPSTCVPVAATLLGREFFNRLNDLMIRHDQSPVEWSQVYREMSYLNDYAKMNRRERRNVLDADQQYFNRDFLAGKTLIFVDDIRITGNHERKLHQAMLSAGMLNQHVFVSLVRFEGRIAQVEAVLNHASIKDAKDLIEVARETPCVVTTRAIRLLLEYDAENFPSLITRAPEEFLESAYYAAIVKGYHRVPLYEANFRSLMERISSD